VPLRLVITATTALFLLSGAFGCATFSDRVAIVHEKVDAGDIPSAVEKMNSILGVGTKEEAPDDWSADSSLAILLRGSLLQAQQDFALSSRDLSGGETQIELLDFTLDTVGQIGSFIYSDSARNYEMPPTERLALNAVNMLNFLALNEWSSAAVEARRFNVMRQYLRSAGLDKQGTFGAYLAGLTFEELGDGNRALRFYEEAMEKGPLESLREPVRRLASSNPFRGPRIEELLVGVPANAATARPTEIVTVFSLGRVPRKAPRRIPIGAAVGLAGAHITGNADVLARSAFKVVVFPELVDSSSRARNATIWIDGQAARVERLTNLGEDIRREYDQIRPRIIGAAVTRMIARALAAEGTRAAAGQVSGTLGLLAALATEGSLVALDRPDTRSWSMLADHILVSRVAVEPGEHVVRVQVTGPGLESGRKFDVRIPKGRTVVLVVTDPH
jgi:hypothetical protein